MAIYTDLALESRELNPDLEGVTEENISLDRISISRIAITTREAAQKLEKCIGNYITLDAPDLSARPLDLFEEMTNTLTSELSNFTDKLNDDATILVVGLGNRYITPDSLGPKVAEQVYVTRQITAYLPDAMDHPLRAVCALTPGVMGVTGVETLEIVKGVVKSIRPDLVIAVDALASRRTDRICTTLQITDTGISPGSGIGNTRAGITRDVLGVPVIAIGVPLVVFASTIAKDTISMIADETGLHRDEEKLLKLADKVINENIGPMIVTPKDIDSVVSDMAKIIADSMNRAFFRNHYDEVRSLIA
ncbi:MAG: GPR endopeptidase [Clostridia bacterium]|nr:GPR endopeptidase [Clostridia bacterium]